MKTFLGYYELSDNQRKILEKSIGNIFHFDVDSAVIRHPRTTPVGYRHIDIIVGKTENETILVTEGASARKIKGMPYLEAFAKLKNASDELCDLLDFLIKGACFNTTEFPPEYECSLFNGFEYLFVDEDEDYHNSTGYWGMFIVPKIKEVISGKEYLFYQLIPAYKEELEFVETHTNMLNYKRFCEAIFNHISDRQYFDVRYEMLTEQQLQDIYNNCFKK